MFEPGSALVVFVSYLSCVILCHACYSNSCLKHHPCSVTLYAESLLWTSCSTFTFRCLLQRSFVGIPASTVHWRFQQ